MSSNGAAKKFNIKTSKGKTFALFVSEQVGGTWASSVLYADETGKIVKPDFHGITEEDVYILAVQWTLNNIDSHANIDPL